MKKAAILYAVGSNQDNSPRHHKGSRAHYNPAPDRNQGGKPVRNIEKYAAAGAAKMPMRYALSIQEALALGQGYDAITSANKVFCAGFEAGTRYEAKRRKAARHEH